MKARNHGKTKAPTAGAEAPPMTPTVNAQAATDPMRMSATVSPTMIALLGRTPKRLQMVHSASGSGLGGRPSSPHTTASQSSRSSKWSSVASVPFLESAVSTAMDTFGRVRISLIEKTKTNDRGRDGLDGTVSSLVSAVFGWA